MNDKFSWFDDSRSFEERVELLIEAMTVEEKVSQMLHEAPAVDRLGIPEYNWWNECLHGVARAGKATVFPQSMGLAATFNPPLAKKIGTAISDEGRAKHHQAIRNGNRGQYLGLTYWTPNINIFRDPRWGRGQETYGECPYLTSRMGVELVKGLQGNDPKYLKSAACAKHFIVHSGPENLRHEFNARVDQRDFQQTYAPAFKALVQEAKVESVMGAYNRTNGELCCGSKKYITGMLRGEWGFNGHFVSDCWAIRDFHENHKITGDMAQSAAYAVKNGCDLNCGCAYEKLSEAIERELLTEDDLDNALRRLFLSRMRLGMFDPDEKVPFANISTDVVNCKEHKELALRAARESVVLLKNDGILPLRKDPPAIAVLGPNAMNIMPLLGNYNGFSDCMSTVIEAVVGKVSVGTQVDYRKGCELSGNSEPNEADLGWVFAHKPEAVIAVMGLTAELEGEEGDVAASDGGEDRENIMLPNSQRKLLEYVAGKGVPVILVIFAGSPIDLRWAKEYCSAIMYGWYPGEAGGTAVADVIFGDYNPAGRLPVTIPVSADDLPNICDYNMKNRTYRYCEKEPLYPFGFGLSYVQFKYSNLVLDKAQISDSDTICVSVDVANAGNCDGEEVVQMYVRDLESSVTVPKLNLAGIMRIVLAPGETKTITMKLSAEQLVCYDDQGLPFLEPGEFEISIGGGQPQYPESNAVSTRIIACK